MVPHRPSFSPFPLILISASFATGVLLARAVAPPLAVCLAGSSCLSILSLFALRRLRLGRASCFILAAFACMGATLAIVEKKGVTEDRVRRFYDEGRVASGEPVEVTGVLQRAPEAAPGGLYLALRVEKWRFKQDESAVDGAVELFAPVGDEVVQAEYEALELRRGARVRLMVALARTDNFRNPGVHSLTEYLERRGFDARGTIKSPLLIERLDDERVFLPLVWLDEWRSELLVRIENLFSADTAGILGAALLGNRYGLSRATAERFRAGGTFHVLVISGFHITFIGGLVWAVARRLMKRRVWQFAAAVVLTWGYTVAVGAEASVVRAALMFTVVALAPVLYRRGSTLNALGGAALALLVWRPGTLFDPSFQLTILSVLIIVTLAWPLILGLKEAGEWRPGRGTPYPPTCPDWWRALGEALFWSQRRWELELTHMTWSCRLFKTPVAERLERLGVQRPLRYAFAATVVSVSVQLGLLPLLVIYFHRLSLASFALNVVVGVTMALLSLASLLSLAVSLLSVSLASPFVWLAEKTCWLMAHSVDPFAKAQIAQVRLPEYTGVAAVVYVLYYVPLVVLASALARWRTVGPAPESETDQVAPHKRLTWRLAVAVLFISFAVIVAHPWSAGWPDARLRVDFLDVGQGDAALVTMPDGETLLIDGGGRPRFEARGTDDGQEGEPFERDAQSIGEAVLSEYLWWRGLDRVDYILATHADSDHIDGLNDVIRNFKVRAALVARAPARDAEYRRFAATAASEGVPIYSIGRGDTLHFGAVSADVLWPPRAPGGSAATASSNEDSIVLRVRFGQRAFLFTGDVEGGAEAALIAARDDLRCDAVKVAHHGSRTSSSEAFVRATLPALAIISVGLTSPFGHPHPKVVGRWRASGAEVLTTGRAGTITVSTDGQDLRVEKYVRD